MEKNISEQIEQQTIKMHYYQSKKETIEEQIRAMEKMRREIDRQPVGSPLVEKFYRLFARLYTQLSTLPSKIQHCQDNIITLKAEQLWS